MTRLNCIAWLLLSICAAAVAPASGQTKVKTSVEKVTLFIDGAQVTRTKQIDLPAGNSTLVFMGLSPYLDDKSMQVAAKGRFTVTAVNRLFNHTDSLERSARQKALEQELARIRLEQQQQKAAREVIDAETDLLKVNCSVGNRNAATPLAAIKELNEYYASRMQELKRRTLELDGRTKALGERERQVLADLAQLGGRQSAPMSEVEVRIEAPAACKGAFTLTYYVRNAGWFPSYDIRSDGLSEPVEISYKANIFQNTREEWKNVGLTLSSSNPTTGNIAPQLKTWWLDYGTTPPRYDSDLTGNTVSGTVFDEQREPLIGASVLVPGTTVGTSTDAQGRYSVTVPDGASSLQFNYIGYKSQTRAIAGSTMNVVMQEDNARLDEVVVTAYGSAPSAALSGKAAGVRVRGKAAPAMEAEFIELAEESEAMEAENVIEYAARLKERLPAFIQVEYLHGKMKPKEKNEIMERFLKNEIQVLVSTTVVEVGVNVPNATVMMIENAERFGLAQLHQLRGRVGRGGFQSYCILMYGNDGKKTKERLGILNRSNDGFYIAEEDLKLRGPGDLFGIRQSGILDFKLGDIFQDAAILKEASDTAALIMEKNDKFLSKDSPLFKKMMKTTHLEDGMLNL